MGPKKKGERGVLKSRRRNVNSVKEELDVDDGCLYTISDSVNPLPTNVAHSLSKNFSRRCSSPSAPTCLFLLTSNIHHAKSMPACFSIFWFYRCMNTGKEVFFQLYGGELHGRNTNGLFTVSIYGSTMLPVYGGLVSMFNKL